MQRHDRFFVHVAEIVIIVFGLFFMFLPDVRADELNVGNVRFYQQEDSQVIVSYDLVGKPAGKYTVVLSLFAPDKKIMIPLTKGAVFGDVGKDVRPGTNKQIRWDLFKDKPNGLKGNNFVFVVDAYSQKESRKLPLFLGLFGALGGGATFFILNSGMVKSASSGPPDLPEPPDLPGLP